MYNVSISVGEVIMKKCEKILLGIISLVLIIAIPILIYDKFEDNTKKISDAEKFKKEYPSVSKENIFMYSNTTEVINILKNGTGVIFFAFPECKYCETYASILNETAKETGIDKIYYLNILNDRKSETKDYITITNLLKDYIICDDEGNKRIYSPDVTIVKNGKIIGHNNESSLITECEISSKNYWTNEKKEALKNKLKIYFNEIKSE